MVFGWRKTGGMDEKGICENGISATSDSGEDDGDRD